MSKLAAEQVEVIGFRVQTFDGVAIADCDLTEDIGTCRANAQRIAHLWSTYDALLAALRVVVSAASAHPEPMHHAVRAAIDEARSAITLAEEEA